MEPVKNRFIKAGTFRKTQSDFTTPENSGLRLLLNPIDLQAVFQHSINVKIATKWKKVREEAKGWWSNRQNFKMGEVQTVAVQSDVWIINALCLSENATDEVALESCLKKCVAMAKYEKASIHVSEDMFNLSGFEALATKLMLNEGINVYVYRNKASQ